MLSFDATTFFYVYLPPIIFTSAYLIDKKVFFDNFSSVVTFGVFGTILQFSLFTLGLYGLNELGFFTKIIPDNSESGGAPFSLSIIEILLMGSLICSSDPIAAIAVVRQEQQPKLFSVVVGEGITNDAVGIILYKTVLHYGTSESSISWIDGVKILGSFVLLCLLSTIIGCVLGIISSFLFKFFRNFDPNV
jgi:solute carrier family 9 (sodium/hydrogen exchanger), member 8